MSEQLSLDILANQAFHTSPNFQLNNYQIDILTHQAVVGGRGCVCPGGDDPHHRQRHGNGQRGRKGATWDKLHDREPES